MIGSPKSTVTVTDAALVGEVASVDRVGAGCCTVEGDGQHGVGCGVLDVVGGDP